MDPETTEAGGPVRAAEWCAIACVLLLVALLAWAHWGQASDDAFITY